MKKKNQIAEDPSDQCHIPQQAASVCFLRHLPTMRHKYNWHKSVNILTLLHQVCRNSSQFRWRAYNSWGRCYKNKIKEVFRSPWGRQFLLVRFCANTGIGETLCRQLEMTFCGAKFTYIQMCNIWQLLTFPVCASVFLWPLATFPPQF